MTIQHEAVPPSADTPAEPVMEVTWQDWRIFPGDPAWKAALLESGRVVIHPERRDS